MPSSPARHAAVALGYRGKQIEKAAAIIDRAIAHPAQERPTSEASELAVEARTPQLAGKSTGAAIPGQYGQPQSAPRVTDPSGCEFCAQPSGTEHLIACRTRDSEPEPGEPQFAYPRVDVDLPDIDPREPYDDIDEARAVVAGDWGAD